MRMGARNLGQGLETSGLTKLMCHNHGHALTLDIRREHRVD